MTPERRDTAVLLLSFAIGAVLLFAIAILAGVVIELISGAPQVSPIVMGRPILECADGSWVDNRAPGACYYHGGLP